MMEVLPGHGRHVFVVGRHHLGCNVIHPGWVSYKKKCIKLKAVGYTHVLLECATAPGTVVDMDQYIAFLNYSAGFNCCYLTEHSHFVLINFIS